MTAKTRVLLVDDDPAVLRTCQRALAALEPLVADDGIAAQKVLSETVVDIVVCDLEMPGMGGLELMRWAREHRPDPVWIVISGRSTLDAAIEALQLGAFDFLCKPFQSILQLQTVVANAGRQRALVADLAERRAVEATHREREHLVAELRNAVALRDEFLSIASHELRTPLTTLQLQLESTIRLVERADGPGAARFSRNLATANRQVLHLASIIDGMLDVARGSFDRPASVRGDVDLVAIARDVVERYAPQAAAAGCAVELETDREVIGSWDRPRLEQAITNLLTNAIKYGGGQPIGVRVTSADGWGRLVVRDDGIGIRAEDLVRVFSRFERAVSSRHYGGLGLGLYIARQIVESHGGTLEATSELERGSTFTMNLPLAVSP